MSDPIARLLHDVSDASPLTPLEDLRTDIDQLFEVAHNLYEQAQAIHASLDQIVKEGTAQPGSEIRSLRVTHTSGGGAADADATP